VQILLSNLTTYLPNKAGKLDGLPKGALSVTTNWTIPQLEAAYNWQFVVEDGSYGVHNAPFATALLKASIANLSGTSVPGGLPDAWETLYFQSITNVNGAPTADPTGDGIPNWLAYALGINPTVSSIAMSNGVVYANGYTLGGSSNAIAIYPAADITFNTLSNWTYQIQEVNDLNGTWEDVQNPIVAPITGSMSYLTPTTGNLQQYFRVVETPP
jgi:hypothetical protein